WLDTPARLAAADPAHARPATRGGAAWAVLPLAAEGAPVGALWLVFAAARRFDARARAAITKLAAQCAQALARTRLHEEAQLERSRGEALASVALHLNAGKTLSEVMGAALKSTAGLLGADDASLFLVEPDGEHIRGALELWRGDRIGAVVALADAPSIAAAVAAGRPRYFTLPETRGVEPEWFARLAIEGCLVAPLMAEGRCLGVLLWNYREGSDGPAAGDLAFAAALAAQAALAIDRAAAHEQRLRALEREKASAETQYRRIVETALEGIVIIDAAARIAFANPAIAELLGYAPAELVGRPVLEVLSDETRAAYPALEERSRRGVRERTEVGLRRRDGALLTALTGATPIFGDGGRYEGTLAMVTDITARTQAERELAAANARLAVLLDEERRARLEEQRLTRAVHALSRCNEALVRATDEAGLLAQVCAIIVEVGGYRLAWVGLAEDDPARTVRVVAHAGADDGYLARVNVTWADTQRGRGPTGRAIRAAAPVILRDSGVDPEFAPWRAAALARGYASVIALPLADAGRVTGALTIYAQEPDAFDADEVKLLAQLADDLAFGMASLRARAERRAMQEELLVADPRGRASPRPAGAAGAAADAPGEAPRRDRP
ncbi:MAG TPA: GAF domain-containing protein, partial [Polyangia bacterium]